MTLYDKLWGQFYNEQTVLAGVHGINQLGNAIGGKATSKGQPYSLAHTILRGHTV